MVASVSRYFGHPFKGYQVVTQGNPLSPTILNVVVDAIILHWVTVLTPIESVMGVLGLTGIDLMGYFYSDDGLVALTQPERLHRAFYFLTGLFGRFGLRKNTENTASMVCQPCHAPGVMLTESYKRRMTGIGPTFRKQHRRRVECPE